MTAKPTHIISEMAPSAPAISIIVLKVKYPLHFVVRYVQPLHSISNQELLAKHLYNPRIQKERIVPHAPIILIIV